MRLGWGASSYAEASVARESFNPKRALHDHMALSQAQIEKWVAAARYGGNPEHKRNPGDFGLTPPGGRGWARHSAIRSASFPGMSP